MTPQFREGPLDGDTIGDQPLYDADSVPIGPQADWTARLSVVHEAAVPLTAVLVEMTERLPRSGSVMAFRLLAGRQQVFGSAFHQDWQIGTRVPELLVRQVAACFSTSSGSPC
ncbi:hypothetical protein GCM10010425_65540 [Streptomyces spororaveus]|uniref:hypothetical protein n=1 Tax=Streptomyces spororaveus TaxID=284039 RepID=UPI0031D305EA